MRLTLIILFLSLCACGQVNDTSSNLSGSDTTIKNQTLLENRYPSRERASAKAKLLMNDDWYFNPVDDMAPFGSDDAADTYAYFYDWRKVNKTGSPKAFVKAHFEDWGYPHLDLESTDYNDFKTFLKKDVLGSRYLFGMDAAIIATAFGQLYLEGKIDDDIREFALKAIKREMLPEILNTWKELKPNREKRLDDFVKILNATIKSEPQFYPDSTVTLFGDMSYKLTLQIFDLASNYDPERNNAVLTFSKQDRNQIQVFFRDSMFCMYPDIDFKDFNNDKIKDVVVFYYTGARANPTYHLYLTDLKNHKLIRIQGFEELPNPDLDTVTNIITSIALSGSDYYTFYRINSKNKLINLGHGYEDNPNDSTQYERVVRQILRENK